MTQSKPWRPRNGQHRRYVIIAGTYDEFIRFCQNRKIRADQAIHARSAADVRGLDYIQVYRTGTWYLLGSEVLTELTDAIRAVDQVGVADDEEYHK